MPTGNRKIRPWRWLALAASVLSSLLLVLLLPPVQRALLKLADRSLDGVAVQAEHLYVAPWGASARNLQLETPGFGLSARTLDIDIDLLASLLERRLVIQEARGQAIDLALGPAAEADAEPEAAPPFQGLSDALGCPRRLSIRELNADGKLSWKLADGTVITGPWQGALGDLAAGDEPELSLGTQLAAHREDAPLWAFQGDLKAQGHCRRDGRMEALDAGLTLTPAGEALAGRGRLEGRATLRLTDERETAQLEITSGIGRRLILLDGRFDPAAADAELNWLVDITPGLAAAFLAREAHAELEAKSAGTMSVDLEARTLHLQGTAEAYGQGWDWFDARLTRIGRLALHLRLDATGWGPRWSSEELSARLYLQSGQEALALDLLQATSVDLDTLSVKPQTWGKPSLRLVAREMPLAWLRGFDPAEVFESGLLDGSLDVVSTREGHLGLVAAAPLQLKDLRFNRKDARELPTFQVTLTPHAELEDGALTAKIEPMLVESSAGGRLSFRGRATTSAEQWPVINFAGGVALRSPAVQRRVTGLEALRGMARFDLDLGDLSIGIEGAGLDAITSDRSKLASLQLEGDAPLRIDLGSRAVDWDNFAPQHMTLKFMGTPISWLSPFLPEIDLADGRAYGELSAVAGQGSGFELKPTEPFVIRDIVPLYRGQRLARNLTLTLEPRVALSSAGGAVVIDNIALRSRSGDRLEGELSLDWDSNPPEQLGMALALKGFFPSLAARIGQLGEMHWKQTGGIDLTSRQMVIADLDIALSDIGGTRFLQVDGLRPFNVANEPFGFNVDGGSARVLKVTLTPLQLQSLLPRLLGLDVEGVLPRGEFYGRVDPGGRLVLAAETPLIFRDVTLSWEGATLVENLKLGMSYEVAYSVRGLEARSFEIEAVDDRGQPLAKVTMQAVAPLTERRPLRSLELDLNLGLNALSRQPILDGVEPLAGGALRTRLTIDNAQAKAIRGQLDLAGATTEAGVKLPDIAGALRIDAAPGEGLNLKLPVTMNSARGRSDLTLSAEARSLGERYRVETTLAGKRMIVPDLRAFYDLLEQAEATDGEADKAESTTDRTALRQLRQRRDAKPFWSDRLLGHAALRLDTLQLRDHVVEGLRGDLQILPHRLSLYGLRAELLEGRLHSTGAIDYHEDRPEPYDFSYRLRISELQLGALLKPLHPDTPPVAEGIFTLSSNLHGQGRNSLDLGLGTLGDIELVGRQGVFRGLAGRGATASTAAKVVGALTFSRQLRAIGRMMDDLDELNFSRLRVSLLRESPRHLQLDEVSLVSPLLRISGRGSVTAEPGLALALSPLEADIGLSTRGDMSVLFEGMGLLEETSDTSGYRSMNHNLAIGGTLSDPDTSDLWNTLDEAAGNARGSFGLGLRAINRKLSKNSP